MIIERYIRKTGTYPNLNNPQTFNEKILWRKLHDRRELLVRLTDKHLSKQYVSHSVNIIPEIGHSIDYIPKSYPFIAKPNHWSGKTLYIADKNDWMRAKEIYRGISNQKYGIEKGEWAYSQIPFRLMIEPVLPEAHEIKLFCFNGECELVRYMPPRKHWKKHPPERIGSSHFLPDGTHIPVAHGKYPMGVKQIPKDIPLPDVIRAGESISQGIDFVRVDLYWSEGVYFGEYSFYPGSGHTKWSDPDFNLWLGKKWTLPIH